MDVPARRRHSTRDQGIGAKGQALCGWMRREFGVGVMSSVHSTSTVADVQLVLGVDLADTLRRRETIERHTFEKGK